MPGRGFPPAPTALKILKGVQPKRINKHEALIPGAIPPPPDVLDEDGAEEWRRIAPLLEEVGLLTKVDRAGLTAYCLAWSDYVAARRQPKVEPRRAAFAQLLRILVEFGLTPSARSRIKVDTPPVTSKLEAFKAKHGD